MIGLTLLNSLLPALLLTSQRRGSRAEWLEPQKRHRSTAGRDHAGMVPIGAPVEKSDDWDLNHPPRSQKESAFSTRLPVLHVSLKLYIYDP